MTLRLVIDGVASGLRVRRARGFLQRLVGFWPSPRYHGTDVIEFSRCRAVHTFGMTRPLDVVFLDAERRVSRVVSSLQPWRIVGDPRAATVLEFRAGLVRYLGVERGVRLECCEGTPITSPADDDRQAGVSHSGLSRLGRSRRSQSRGGFSQRGASMIEFLLASTLVILPLIAGILEFAQLAVARQVLAQATADAARTLAITVMDSGGDLDSSGEALIVRASLARGLLPMLGGRFATSRDDYPIGMLEDRPTEYLHTEGPLRDSLDGPRAWGASVLETMRPDRLQLEIERDVVRSADTSTDVIRVTYCRELFFTPTRYVLPATLRFVMTEAESQVCLITGRMPLSVAAPATRSLYP